MEISKLSVLILLALFLLACSTTKEDPYKGWTPKKFYTEAKLELENDNLEQAIEIFEKLQSTYPASKYSAQAKLEIAYALFKNKDYKAAISSLESYIKLYPNSSYLDYAYYMRGVISEQKNKSLLDNILIDEGQKNIKGIEDSLDYYTLLIKKFPESKYSKEAITQLIKLRNILAKHELLVASLYYRKNLYVAAVNRAQYIIKNYPNTPSVPIALTLLIKLYDRMQMTELEKDTQRVLDASYPDYHIELDAILSL